MISDAELIAQAESAWHAAEDVLNRLGADLTWEQEKQAMIATSHADRMTLGAAIMAMGTLLMLLDHEQRQPDDLGHWLDRSVTFTDIAPCEDFDEGTYKTGLRDLP